MSDAGKEIGDGGRFAFGENWSRFLNLLDDTRISDAMDSLKAMLGVDGLDGQQFVDVGSGSGLFSLAARKFNAEVVSFDFDPASVACTAELRRRYFPSDASWRVMQGSVLDRSFVDSLGQYDVVYSWGVLHHTGDMWAALGNVADLVKPGGRLFISIYNDQGAKSKLWKRVKQRFNSAGPIERWLLLNGVDASARILESAARRVNRLPKASSQAVARGMDRRVDVIDWVGGYPFEVATPEGIFEFYRARGLSLDRLKTCAGSHGCNEFVFTRSA